MSDFVPFLIFCAVFVLIGVWRERRARARLVRWLAAHGAVRWRIGSAWNPFGPARRRPTRFSRHSRHGIYFRVEIQDVQSRSYAGWARCLGWLRPAGTDDVEVAWDDGFIDAPGAGATGSGARR